MPKQAIGLVATLLLLFISVNALDPIQQATDAPIAPNILLHGCMLKNVTNLPFCDPSLSPAVRAKDLRLRLTMSEKLCLMDSKPCAVPRLGLPGYNWGVEDLHGAGTECLNGTAGPRCPTIFPVLSVLASSFNETLWQKVGAVIGTEMRAANNAGARRGRHPARPGESNANPFIGVNGWGPNLNIARDPRWGRNEEVPSEDSFLSGKVGAYMTKGIQGDGLSDKYVLLLGALKHVTAYSLENWHDDTGGPRNGSKYNRMGFTFNISRHDLAETYLEQYRIAIAESQPYGMMCSYAAVNGTPSCENGKLLQTWARESAGFAGNVVSDCGALKMPSDPKDPIVSSADALNAGLDLDCGTVFDKGLAAAIAKKLTTEDKLDESIERSFALLMRTGYFDPLEMVPVSQWF
jgi:beta-glucosidase-like glycosyl hydrolase